MLHPAPAMQRVITAIAARHGLNLAEPGSHLRLTLPGYMPLVIEVVGLNHLSIAHYYEQHGDLIADPDLEIVIADGQWIPTAITQMGVYDQGVIPTETGVTVYPARQAAIAEFAAFWADNLDAQGWASERAQKAPIAVAE